MESSFLSKSMIVLSVTKFSIVIGFPRAYLCTCQCQARGGEGSGNPREFNCDVYLQGGDLIAHHAFDLSISNSGREVNHSFLLIFKSIFRLFLENAKIPTLCSNSPPSGLALIVHYGVITWVSN